MRKGVDHCFILFLCSSKGDGEEDKRGSEGNMCFPSKIATTSHALLHIIHTIVYCFFPLRNSSIGSTVYVNSTGSYAMACWSLIQVQVGNPETT